METKFEKFQNELPLIFGTHEFMFKKVDDVSCCVRSFKTAMFCGCEIERLIKLAHTLGLHFYVRSALCEDSSDCVEFVIY